MRFIAELVMRGSLAAGVVAGVGNGLSLLWPPLTAPLAYIGGAAVALVTLRQGGGIGLQVLMLALLASALFGALLGWGLTAPGLAAGATLVPLWGVAWWLRRSVSLAQAVALTGILGLAVVVVTGLVLGEPAAWWRPRLEQMMGPMLSELGRGDSEQVLDLLAAWMDALLAAAMVLGVLASLLLGRWWQALLYNPGGFAKEFHALRLPQPYVALWLLSVVTGMFVGGGGVMAVQASLLLALPLLIAGLGLMHGVAAMTPSGRYWLAAVYLLLVLAGGYTMPLLVMMAAVDAWMDWRARIRNRGGGDGPE